MNLKSISCAALVASLLGYANADAIDDYIHAELERQEVPGVAIGIFKNGQVLRAQGYGLANLEHQIPVQLNTVFQTASIGKMFTGAAVLLLVEDGKLNLDVPITDYLANVPQGWQVITLRHLLNHTSGLGYPDLDFKQDYDDEQLLKRIAAAKPDFAPGQRWAYSNAGYMVAGIIVNKTAQQHYSDVLAERVFQPANMHTVRKLSHIDIVPNRAAGYQKQDGALKNQDWVSVSLNSTADGSLQMSVLDFANWDAVVAQRGLFKAESWQQALTPAPLNNGSTYAYGFGWSLPDADDGPKHIGHSGAWQGFRSDYRRYDEDGISFVVLANASHANAGGILQGIAERFDARYKAKPDAPIEDEQPNLTNAVQEILSSIRAGKAADHAVFSALPAERRDVAIEHMRKTLDDAGQCELPVLYREGLNGDRLQRGYLIACTNKPLWASAVFDEAGQLISGRVFERRE